MHYWKKKHEKCFSEDEKCPFNYSPSEIFDALQNKCWPAFQEDMAEAFGDFGNTAEYWAHEAENFFETAKGFFKKYKPDF